jgi:hypothetical protein
LPQDFALLQATSWPLRSVTAPAALTTVKAAILVPPIWRNAPPCPEWALQPK